MSFDGSLYDGLTGEPVNRFLRPATVDQALARYPLFILRLKQGSLQMTFQAAAEHPRVLRASNPGRVGERWVMLGSDFDRCKRVAEAVDVSLFTTDPISAVLGRISAQIRVVFG